MKKAMILKNKVVTHEGLFHSQAELNAWLEKHINKGTFGKPAHTLEEKIEIESAVFDKDGNEVSPAKFEIKETFIPAEYEVEFQDISPQLEQEKINAEALKLLAESDFKVLRHIRQKALGQETSLSEEEYLALEQERSDAASRIVR